MFQSGQPSTCRGMTVARTRLPLATRGQCRDDRQAKIICATSGSRDNRLPPITATPK
jgi:hypothetical protein